MRGTIIWTVFQKEIRDLFRDTKTWVGTFLIPLVIVPFVFFLMGSSYSSLEEEARAHVPLFVQGTSGLLAELEAIPGVQFQQPADPEAALQGGKLRAIITIPDGFDDLLAAGAKASLHIEYDVMNQKSVYARDVIEEKIAAYSKKIVAKRLQAAGLSETAIEPINAVYEQITSEDSPSGGVIGGVIPLMLVISLASGGIAVANDLISGERERGTLESLMSAPIAANQLLTAKLMTVMVMSCMSAAASLVSLALILRFGPFGGEGIGLSVFTPATTLLLLLTILLQAAFFAGLELMLSTLAKSIKEGQTYMSGIMFVAMVPSYMLMPLHPVDIAEHYYLLPIFSGVALIKEIVYGKVDPVHAATCLGTSLLYVGLVVALTARFFRREGAVVKH